MLNYAFLGTTAKPEATDPTLNNAITPNPLPGGPGQQTDPAVGITINRMCRVVAVTSLGFWSGWSLLPGESSTPASTCWVVFICTITNWVVFTTLLDCLWPLRCDWYFRKPINFSRWTSAVGGLRVPVTGFRLFNTIITVGYLLFKWIMINNSSLTNRTDIYIGLFGVLLYWLSFVEMNQEAQKWIFHYDYGPALFNMFSWAFAWTSWWWIALRILSIVKILRHRHDPTMRFQFVSLAVGLATEGTLLLLFFLIPCLRYFFKKVPWHESLWLSHSIPIFAMFVCWLVVLIVGFVDVLPNIFFPCSGVSSVICSVMAAS